MFDQYHVGKQSNKTLIKHNHFLDLVRLIWISTFYVLKKVLKNEKIRLKTTYSCIVELNPNNCRTKHCRTSQQSPKFTEVRKQFFIKISNLFSLFLIEQSKQCLSVLNGNLSSHFFFPSIAKFWLLVGSI